MPDLAHGSRLHSCNWRTAVRDAKGPRARIQIEAALSHPAIGFLYPLPRRRLTGDSVRRAVRIT
jgi:hypothetical protein